ncbi:FHA domain-containing protein [Candidatus Synechococcus calcipolaris G9]|uniref:FHA domain-containing protein n=1 Tax=Candidatus Synechococcus calcipolaris G9 TaxID=1497997 RepID=A0ABT6F2I8_9SYNE|nr:ATP transporter ATP-binding protein/permease [Candidatus Synechococcus calcipolaris]MDG2992080.1 FHA domain-containing protein [Candidatus Synechococcus calcipolaris G9]
MAENRATLELRATDGTIQTLVLEGERTFIGQGADNQIVLIEEGISRHHACILFKDSEYALVDMGSAQGTLLNQVKLRPRQPARLNAGDRLHIGTYEAIFQLSLVNDLVSDSASEASNTHLPGTVVMGATATPMLQVATPQWLQEFPLKQDNILFGRDPQADIAVDHGLVSYHHARLEREGDRYRIIDQGSKNGLWLRGVRVTDHLLEPGDVLRIGEVLTLTYLLVASTQVSEHTAPLNLRHRRCLTLGRDPANDTVLDHPVVSRFHAQVELVEGQWQLQDLDAANGTYLNNRRVHKDKPLAIYGGDVIRIGPYSLVFSPDETIVPHNDSGNLRLDAIHLSKVTPKGARLLQDISLSILPREFVAIVGGSGAGKSTLLDALNGFRPATGGTVLVNGYDLYRNFNAYRTQIGYVPQDDIIHPELTVAQALDYAAQLRLPADTSLQERQKQVNKVLDDLALIPRRHVPVKSLSGGQRKRVSIGVELLTRPSLFFLDEATSGLDPGTETQMMQLLRKLADQGRTVLLITHATKNVMMCDLVVFLARGGYLAYFGPPDQALPYFGVQDFDEIYLKIEDEPNAEKWQHRYGQSRLYQDYVGDRQRPLEIDTQASRQINEKRQPPPIPNTGISGWRQWLILTQRNLSILTQDRAAMILMLLLAPVLGLLDFVLWKPNILDADQGDAGQAFTMAFVAVLIAVMVGSLTTMREIVKETEIYRRERMVGLQIWPYIFSKLGPSFCLALYQAAVFLGLKLLAVRLETPPEAIAGLFFTLFLTTFGGMIMGLLVSALSPTQTVAPLLAILFLVPQITFAGAIIPLKDLGIPGRLISDLTLTRWSYANFVSLVGFGRDVVEDPCWQLPKSDRENLGDRDKTTCPCLGENLFSQCNFPGVRKEYDPAVRQPEPSQPEEPGDAPALPESIFDFDDTYRENVEAYNQRVKDYQAAMDQWQDEFAEWKEKRGRAIASGEALIDRFWSLQSHTFEANLLMNWLRLGGIVTIMLLLVGWFQKRKDIL